MGSSREIWHHEDAIVLREVAGLPVTCACGQSGEELDHIDPLSLANASRDVR